MLLLSPAINTHDGAGSGLAADLRVSARLSSSGGLHGAKFCLREPLNATQQI
jgi:hypothetical protein